MSNLSLLLLDPSDIVHVVTRSLAQGQGFSGVKSRVHLRAHRFNGRRECIRGAFRRPWRLIASLYSCGDLRLGDPDEVKPRLRGWHESRRLARGAKHRTDADPCTRSCKKLHDASCWTVTSRIAWMLPSVAFARRSWALWMLIVLAVRSLPFDVVSFRLSPRVACR